MRCRRIQRGRGLRAPSWRRGAALLATTLAVLGAGVAWGGELPSQLSSNWAGWVATAGGASARLDRHFIGISATWVQPTAACTPGRRAFAAFWVGLGGYSTSSRSLEQVGTEADCSSRGQLFYYAWYELVPSPAVTIDKLRIGPGDEVAAHVHVSSDRVTVSIADLTSGARPFELTKVMRRPGPDTSAAEWIAEAPSNCVSSRCTPLRLTDFGAVSFNDATASAIGSAGRHSGPICDPTWRQYGMIVLQRGTASDAGSGDRVAAEPTPLSADGRSFSVAYGPTAATGSTRPCLATGPSGTTGATS